jgi:hypothetical protein
MKFDRDDLRIIAVCLGVLLLTAITLIMVAAILGAAVQTFRWVGGF